MPSNNVVIVPPEEISADSPASRSLNALNVNLPLVEPADEFDNLVPATISAVTVRTVKGEAFAISNVAGVPDTMDYIFAADEPAGGVLPTSPDVAVDSP